MEKPNLEYIEVLADGDEAFKLELISVIKNEFPKEVKTYKENLSSNNFTKLAENVHKIKHKINILGLTASYQLAQEYEEKLKQQDASLSTAFNAVLENISNFIVKL